MSLSGNLETQIAMAAPVRTNNKGPMQTQANIETKQLPLKLTRENMMDLDIGRYTCSG